MSLLLWEEKMKNFTFPGFARFYRSLLRFNRDMESAQALELTYDIYTAIYDSFRHKNPHIYAVEYNKIFIREMLLKSDVKPYRTEIQLYRAMEAVLQNTNVRIIRTESLENIMLMLFLMGDIELRFYKAFNMEICDKRTTYSLCVKNLDPKQNEPGLCLCLMNDWLDVISA